MTSTPRVTLNDDFIDGMNCAICGQDSLQIVHVDNLPDYVACTQCSSAFVVEESGERVMYGKIDPSYAETHRFAFRQWVWPSAVERRAAQERPPIVPTSEPAASFPTETPPPESRSEVPIVSPDSKPFVEYDPSELEPKIGPDIQEDVAMIPSKSVDTPGEKIGSPAIPATPEIQEVPIPKAEPPVKEADVPQTPSLVLPENDPPVGHRYRVVLRGTKVKFPRNVCAHCMATPTRSKVAVPASLPKGKVVGQRQSTTFKLPLCSRCNKRAARRSDEEKVGRLQMHLISTLVALVLFVTMLALGVDPRERELMDTLTLAFLVAIGYTGSALLIGSRLGPYPVPPDAAYVRSTLLVPSEVESLETAFEWRNQAYADRFHQVNEEYSLGNIVKVKDRINLEDL
jgi:hypothetical protein